MSFERDILQFFDVIVCNITGATIRSGQAFKSLRPLLVDFCTETFVISIQETPQTTFAQFKTLTKLVVKFQKTETNRIRKLVFEP